MWSKNNYINVAVLQRKPYRPIVCRTSTTLTNRLKKTCRIWNVTVHCYLTVMIKSTRINKNLKVTFQDMLLPQINMHIAFYIWLLSTIAGRKFYETQNPLISVSPSHTPCRLLTFAFLFLRLLVERYRPLFQRAVTIIVLLNQKRPWHCYTVSPTHKSQEGYRISKTPLPEIPKMVHLQFLRATKLYCH
jgi:hypothetical protein